jgi:hypothetical protein
VIFNIKNNTLYTNKGELIKKLSCPFKIEWEELNVVGIEKRRCDKCSHLILDSGKFRDEELLGILNENPSTCLMVDFNQSNLTLKNYDF